MSEDRSELISELIAFAHELDFASIKKSDDKYIGMLRSITYTEEQKEVLACILYVYDVSKQTIGKVLSYTQNELDRCLDKVTLQKLFAFNNVVLRVMAEKTRTKVALDVTKAYDMYWKIAIGSTSDSVREKALKTILSYAGIFNEKKDEKKDGIESTTELSEITNDKLDTLIDTLTELKIKRSKAVVCIPNGVS